MERIIEKQKELMSHIPHGHIIKSGHQALVVAACGVIEEVMEYLNSIGFKSWRPNPLPKGEQLEELTDIVFFVAELIILSGFSWAEVEEEYVRKWKVNLERYRRAKEGDFRWDLRGKKEGL